MFAKRSHVSPCPQDTGGSAGESSRQGRLRKGGPDEKIRGKGQDKRDPARSHCWVEDLWELLFVALGIAGAQGLRRRTRDARPQGRMLCTRTYTKFGGGGCHVPVFGSVDRGLLVERTSCIYGICSKIQCVGDIWLLLPRGSGMPTRLNSENLSLVEDLTSKRRVGRPTHR